MPARGSGRGEAALLVEGRELAAEVVRDDEGLAAAYQAAGRTSEAIALYERTLADREAALGDTHPDPMTSRNNLAAYQAAKASAEQK